MLLAVLWIYFVCFLHLGHGLSHHIRHERTRYMSGRNQIYASGLSPKFDFTENYIPFVQFWERPLQVLESSMGVPKRLSSRPLFSWDIPVQMSTYTPTKKQSTSENPTPTTTETSTWSFSKESKPPDSNEVSSVTYLPKSVQQVRSDRLNRAKDSVTYRTSYVYNSTPTKKKKSINRKKSIEGFLQSNNLKWKETNDQSLNSVKYANESSVKSLNHKKDSKKKKKKGKKSKKGKSVNGKRSKIAAMVEKLKKGVYEEMNDFSPVLTVNKAEYLDKHSPINVLKPKQRMMSLEQKKIDIPEIPRISACEIMEDKCEHKCRDENGTAVCTCFQGFTPVGTKCIDIDECLTDNGGCNGRCINTIGSRKCYCYPGFRLIDGACADINECLLRNGHGPCQDRCTNTLGGYFCSCEGLPGTTLSSDNHTCEDSNVCNSGTDGCSHSCISISGRTFCTCPDGMELGADWKTCHDIDECSNPEDYNVECEYGCINTIGSYACADQTTATVDIST